MAKATSTRAKTSSTMVRRQLGRRLRALREACGKTRDDVIATRLMSKGKLEAIEHGRVMVRPGDAYELGRLYDAAPDMIEGLRQLAIATTQEGWWQSYDDNLAAGFETYLDLESYATKLWIYEPNVIHGLLQTDAYAFSVERASARPDLDDDTIRTHVRLRMARQQALLKRAPAAVHMVLGESALRLRVGDDVLMSAQREKLLTLAKHDAFDLRVLPEQDGAHPALLGGFALLDFADPEDPSVAYIESYVGARFNEKEAHVARHREVFEVIYERARPIKEYLA